MIKNIMKHFGVFSCILLMTMLLSSSASATPTIKFTSGYTTIFVDGSLLLTEDGKTRNFTKQTTAQAAAATESFNCNNDCLVQIVPGVVTVTTTQDAVDCPAIPEVPECPEPEIPDVPEPVLQEIVYRVNIAGPFVASIDDGPDWEEDSGSNPSAYVTKVGDDILATSDITNLDSSIDIGTTPGKIVETRRTDNPGNDAITMTFDAEPGLHMINLYVADSYYSEAGKRIFDVSVNGWVTDDFNGIDPIGLFGKGIGGKISQEVLVSDDGIVLEFIHNTGNTSISAIEIVRMGDTPATDIPDTPGDVVINEATLTWDAPTSRENGDPLALSEISGYQIEYWVDAGDKRLYNLFLNEVTSVTLSLDSPGEWKFRVRAKDTDGLISSWSDTITKIVT